MVFSEEERKFGLGGLGGVLGGGELERRRKRRLRAICDAAWAARIAASNCLHAGNPRIRSNGTRSEEILTGSARMIGGVIGRGFRGRATTPATACSRITFYLPSLTPSGRTPRATCGDVRGMYRAGTHVHVTHRDGMGNAHGGTDEYLWHRGPTAFRAGGYLTL